MNTKKILGVVAVLALVAVALVGAGAAVAGDKNVSLYYDDDGTWEYSADYDTLADAYEAFEGQTGTINDTCKIVVNDNHESAGFGSDNGISGANVTIDLNGCIVTMTGPAVGSTGTKSQAIRNLAGNTMLIENGMLRIISTNPEETGDDDIAMFIHNHGTMTIDGVYVDGTNLKQAYYNDPSAGTTYTVDSSSTSTGLTIENSTITVADNDGITEDVTAVNYDGTSNGGLSISDSIIEVANEDDLMDMLSEMTSGTVELVANVTLTSNTTIPAGLELKLGTYTDYTLYVPVVKDATLTIEDGCKLTNNGTIAFSDFTQINGDLENNGSLVGNEGNPIITIKTNELLNHVVVYDLTSGSEIMVNPVGEYTDEDGNLYEVYQFNDVSSITPVYAGDVLGFTNINGFYVHGDDSKYVGVVYNDLGTFTGFTYVVDEVEYPALNGYMYDVSNTEVNVVVNTNSTATALTDTIVNAYYYVTGYNEGINPTLVPGYVYVDNNGNSFNVPTADGWYLTPEDAPAGTYYHKIGTGSNDYDQMVYVSPAKLSYSKISEKTIYTGDKQDPNYTEITIEDANNMYPYLIFEKADVEGVFVDMGDLVDVVEQGKFKVYADANYKGTWNVYADFSQTVDEYGFVSPNDNLYNKTPAEYKFVQIGTFKVAADKADTDSSMTVSTDEITDGNVFSITVKSDYIDSVVDPNYVIVEYYEDGDKSDDAVQVWEKGVKSDAKFFYVTGQSAYEDGKIYIPATEVVTIGIQANVKALTDKTYHFNVYTHATADDKKGGSDNPMTFDLKVKGNTFTANLAKTSYVKGESVTVEGSYSNTDENFLPYVYVEGTNTAFFAPTYATKYTTASGSVGTPAKTIKDGQYTLVFAAENFSSLNAGTYTVYVSKEICNEVANADKYTTDNEYNQYQLEYDETSKKYTNGVSKLTTIENAKVMTLVLKESMIEITSVTKEVQAGSNLNNGKGYYLTAQIEAEGTDKISLYIVGQNKLFYIDGDYAVQKGFVKTLNKNKSNYLFDDTPYVESANYGNRYYYINDDNTTIADDKSVSKVAQKLGLETEEYPLFLIIDNENGTFTAYIHIQASSEDSDYEFDTKLGLGQYYLVAQHPMADGIFNTFAGWFDEDGQAWYYDEEDKQAVTISVTGGYTSGNNVYTNATLMFNVPAVQNLAAAQALVSAIESGNDSQHGKDFYVVAQANDAEFITAPEASYKQGETITIVIGNVNGVDYDNGTLEANTFDFTAENLNYIQTFAVTKKTNEDSGLETVTFTLDTSGVPGGDYVIVLKDDDEVKKVYETKIIASTTPVVEVSVSIAGASSLTVGDTTVLTAKNSDGSTAKFAWKSSDASVASVDESGNVVAKKAGTVTITVTNTVTGKTATKTIVVADKSTPVTPTPTKTPGFGILAALAGLGAVAALVLRRK